VSHRISASKTDLALSGCVYWARPDVELPEDVSGPSADQGTRLHAAAEAYALGIELPPIAEDIVGRWVHMKVWIDAWASAARTPAMVEPAFLLDPHNLTSTALPRVVNRDYGGTRGQIGGRADLARVHPDYVEVWDYKTGETVPRAADAGQLKSLAVMVAMHFGQPRAVVHMVHCRDEGVTVDSACLEAWDLDVHAAALRHAVDSVPGAQPSPGDHCRWCPARTVCPAVVSAMVNAPTMTVTSIEDVARIWPLLKPIEDAIAAIRSAIKDHVSAGDVPLPGGKKLRMCRGGGGEYVDMKALATAVGIDGMAKLREIGAIKSKATSSYVREAKE
jgi:RecB family exonuclease